MINQKTQQSIAHRKAQLHAQSLMGKIEEALSYVAVAGATYVGAHLLQAFILHIVK